jgi:ABC-type siderophore export system fused ATPase/permease subunit
MDPLKELHAEGATVCMVTQDPRYAEMADRTVHLVDGRIVEETVDAQALWRTRVPKANVHRFRQTCSHDRV